MPNDVRQAIAAEVRAAMARHQKTQREAAEVLGAQQAVVSLRLTGKRSFRAEEIAVLAAWLGEPVASLVPLPTLAVAA